MSMSQSNPRSCSSKTGSLYASNEFG